MIIKEAKACLPYIYIWPRKNLGSPKYDFKLKVQQNKQRISNKSPKQPAQWPSIISEMGGDCEKGGQTDGHDEKI